MTVRLLLAPVLLIALAACNNPAPAPTADTPAATPAADAAPAPSEPAVAAETLAKPNLEPGKDYVEIEGGQPLAPLDGKIEVVEVFTYWCGHCNEFEPLVRAWQSKLPADVRFTFLPMAGGPNDTLAKVYFAAETTGMLDKVHDTMFHAIHAERSLSPNASVDQILEYLGGKGVDTKTLGSAMESFAMQARLNQSMQFAMRSGVTGTPTLVVNGKYRILGRSQNEVLQIANALIAQERAAAAGK